MFADDKEPPASPDSRTLDDSGFGEGDESEFDDVSTASSERDPILQESIELPDRSSTLTPDLKNLAMRDSVSEQLGSTDNGDVQAETGQSMPNFPQILDQPLHTENNIIVKGKILEKSSGQSFKLELLAEEEIDEMGASKPASTIPLQIVGTFENNTITVKASKVSEGKPIEEKVENIKYNEGDQIKILIDVREESFKVYANDEAIGGISYSDLSIVKKITVDGYIDVNSVVVEDRVRRQAIALSYDELRALQNTLLTTLNARRGNATGDGNCFYNSVSLILHGNEQASGDLRKTCIEHMVKNADHFKPIFLIHIKQNNLEFRMFEKYVEDQAKDEAWAEWPEIVCMADYLGQEIHIYVTNNDPTEKAEPRVAKPETEPIRLLYNGQTHYDAIIKKDQKDRSHKADDANDPAMGADIPELPEAEEAIEKPAPDDKQARIKELKEAIEILYSKYSENAVVIKDNKVVNEVVCNITNCKKVVLKPGMRNDNANVAIQDHIAKHFYEDEVNGHQYRFICKECNKGYNKCEDGRNHYRKSCKKMDKEKYPSWKDGFIDNMNDWPFEPVRNIVLKIFDDEGFITKLPKIIVDNWREQIQEKLNALEADTVDLFKIPDDGLVRCRHCGASLNFEDPNSIQTIADHFSKMNSEWTTKTWTTNKLKPVILEAMLTSGNVYDLPGHYHNLLKNHLVDKKFIDLGAQIVEKIKEKTEIKEKHKIYALVDGQHLRELLEQSDFDKILTDPIIYIGKGLSNRPSAHCSRDLRNALEHFIHDVGVLQLVLIFIFFPERYYGPYRCRIRVRQRLRWRT
ncbi:hypothetical protein WR25_01968 isoform C [Diploscapter pachys]|uniref:Ubiquitinyl hydrolase 1 n=3 Tax=Diploscapter pachys TaxID=2018661 RepID=A0A2A2L136_9BILA|nr:hypothetical protein WR25_01968 isoform A [Diploscapter pachys]PAV79860.1 hypothetical protein WR25_01968 isoform B [Diploscapter pachys]PAV79861.1 hypothetical protein WR25_01968 isoform C [Diploscapter pachys]